jgi:acyl-CoA synthetase (AMP-forming)/AMP-acid ligase II
MNIARVLWDTAEAMPERVAIRDAGTDVRYAGLVARTSAIAESLRAAGVRAGDRVCIVLPHGADCAAAFYGAAAVGAVATVVSFLSRPRQVEQVVAHAQVAVLLTSKSWLAQQARALESEVRVLLIEDVPAAGTWTPVEAAGNDAAQINYTSGSTGGPKGVIVSHANLAVGIRTVVDYLHITGDDRIASLLPFSFVYGFNQLNCALATGARLDIIASPLAQEIVRALQANASTVLAAVPPLWMQLLKAAEFRAPLPDLRLLTCAGGRLAPDAVRDLRTVQPQAELFLMYGLTEVFRSTFLPPTEVDAHPDSMGRAVPGAKVYVVRDDGSLCGDEEVGELVHAGPTVALGYWNDPDATARVFRPNPDPQEQDPTLARAVYSGDLVRRDAEGRLYYVGRKDRMIKTLGFRVSPDEIADVLYASQQVSEAVATAEPDPQRGMRIVAHVVLAPTGSLEELRRYCGVELPRHMVPARWDVRESLPRNASGKFDLVALDASRAGASERPG